MLKYTTITATARHDPTKIQSELSENGYYLANRGKVCEQNELTGIADYFGGIWHDIGVQTIAPTATPQFIAQTTEAIPPHNECAYAVQPPRYLLLHCRVNEVSDGNFYLLDGSAVVQSFSEQLISLLYHSQFQCLIDPTNPQLVTLAKHNQSGFYLQYSCIGHSHDWMTNSNYIPVAPFYQGYENIIITLQAQLKREGLREYHCWEEGDVLILDNQRFLHGRDAFGGFERCLDHIRIS